MGHNWDLKTFCERGYFTCLTDTTHAIGIELNVVERIILQQFAEAEDGEFVLAASDGNSTITFQLFISTSVVGNHGFFQPAQLERLKQRQHALGVIQRPSHIGVAHEIDVIANDLAHVANEFNIFLHAGSAINGTPAEAQLHHLVAFILIFLRFGTEFRNWHGIQTAGVDGNLLFRAPTQQAKHGLFGVFAEQVPECDIDRRDSCERDTFSAECQRAPIHLLPEELHIPRVRAE